MRFVFVIVAVLQILTAGCGQTRPAEFTGQAAWRYLVQQCDYGPRVIGSAAHDSTVAFIVGRLRCCKNSDIITSI